MVPAGKKHKAGASHGFPAFFRCARYTRRAREPLGQSIPGAQGLFTAALPRCMHAQRRQLCSNFALRVIKNLPARMGCQPSPLLTMSVVLGLVQLARSLDTPRERLFDGESRAPPAQPSSAPASHTGARYRPPIPRTHLTLRSLGRRRRKRTTRSSTS